MPKIWIDLTTPKQVMYFKRLIESLHGRKSEVLVTSRDYYELTQMLETHRIDAKIVGKHGGKTLKGKLIASLKRAQLLLELVSEEQPDLLVSLTSDVASRVAFGLQIPHITCSDTPWAFAVNKLSIPFANKLFAPKATSYEDWRQFGILEQDIIYYDAVDAAAWIKHLKPDPNILNKLGLNKDDVIVVLRPEETYAAYVREMDIKEPVIYPTIRAVLKKFPDARIVALPRYEEHKKLFKNDFSGKIIIPESPIDVPSLLTHASLEMGFGGTITQEAAILGVPAISTYLGYLWCDEYLKAKGLLYKAETPEEAAEIAVEILGKRKEYLKKHKARANKVLETMEDPIEKLVDVTTKFLKQIKKKTS
ncbi:MAG: DUF354 domain-containing protein [Candidatus Helarchaeota archaeon]